MTIEGARQQLPPNGRGPWWVAAAGGGGGIIAAVLQYHALGWAIVIAFVAWLIHNIAIAWLMNSDTRQRKVLGRGQNRTAPSRDRSEIDGQEVEGLASVFVWGQGVPPGLVEAGVAEHVGDDDQVGATPDERGGEGVA